MTAGVKVQSHASLLPPPAQAFRYAMLQNNWCTTLNDLERLPTELGGLRGAGWQRRAAAKARGLRRECSEAGAVDAGHALQCATPPGDSLMASASCKVP